MPLCFQNRRIRRGAIARPSRAGRSRSLSAWRVYDPVKAKAAGSFAAAHRLARAQPDDDTAVEPSRSLELLDHPYAFARDLLFVQEVRALFLAIESVTQQHRSGFDALGVGGPPSSTRGIAARWRRICRSMPGSRAGMKGIQFSGTPGHHLVADVGGRRRITVRRRPGGRQQLFEIGARLARRLRCPDGPTRRAAARFFRLPTPCSPFRRAGTRTSSTARSVDHAGRCRQEQQAGVGRQPGVALTLEVKRVKRRGSSSRPSAAGGIQISLAECVGDRAAGQRGDRARGHGEGGKKPVVAVDESELQEHQFGKVGGRGADGPPRFTLPSSNAHQRGSACRRN